MVKKTWVDDRGRKVTIRKVGREFESLFGPPKYARDKLWVDKNQEYWLETSKTKKLEEWPDAGGSRWLENPRTKIPTSKQAESSLKRLYEGSKRSNKNWKFEGSFGNTFYGSGQGFLTHRGSGKKFKVSITRNPWSHGGMGKYFNVY